MKDQETRERFVMMRAKGRSYATISRELGVAKSTLVNWAKEYREQIGNLQTIESEALMEKHKVLQKHRIESLAKMLKTVEKELQTRDLSGVGDAALVKLQLTLLDRLESYELTFEQTKSYEEANMEKMVGGTKESWRI